MGSIGDEPAGIGLFGANVGSGQRRFWFVPRSSTSQDDLYDRVSGLFLREIDPGCFVRALYLYPRGSANPDLPDLEAFMLLIGTQRDDAKTDEILETEYDRLVELAIEAFADKGQEHSPSR